MSQWHEHASHDPAPAHRLEAELRYTLVAPLVHEASVWVDLGAGTGVGAAAALQGRLAGRALLVDASAEALEQAGRELPGAETLQADLETTAGTDAVRTALQDAPAGGLVTCFEALPHLSSFVPAVDLLLELGTQRDFTVVISVPNDAFWSIPNPAHQTSWGEGAVEELARLLPADHVRLEQVELRGSAIAPAGEDAALPLADAALSADRVASHFFLAFGPQAHDLAPQAGTRQADAGEERRHERERASRLALLEARVQELESAR
jgi:SAM-dependent methyltransferase